MARNVEARKLARERMASKLADAKANEDALTKFFDTDTLIDAAGTTRSAAYAKADREYEKATARARGEQAELLAQMKTRGLSDKELAEMTGLSVAEVRKATKPDTAPTTTRKAEAKESSTKDKTTTESGTAAATASESAEPIAS